MPASITRDEILQTLRKELPYLRDRYGVEKMAVYGSFAKDLQAESSDIDILVQFSRPLGLDFIRLVYYLEEILGREVDLDTFDGLRRSAENPQASADCPRYREDDDPCLSDVGIWTLYSSAAISKGLARYQLPPGSAV